MRKSAVRRPLHQLHCERAADAIAEEAELADTEVVHEPKLVVGERVPRVVDGDRASGFGGVPGRGVGSLVFCYPYATRPVFLGGKNRDKCLKKLVSGACNQLDLQLEELLRTVVVGG